MSEQERQYKSLTGRLGAAMLVFFGLFIVYSLVITVIGTLTEGHGVRGEVIYQITYGLMYAAVFCLPVLFFRLISKKHPRVPMSLAPTVPRETPLYIFLGIAVILSAAYLNSLLLEVFGYSEFMESMMDMGSVSANYQVVLMVFTTAVVPGFVEEFLFRGLVLTNLLPYGRTTAILGSALLFGIMHQNAGQLLYATVAGLVLGYVYVKTGSIWPSVLLHFVNNFYSVLQTVWVERLSAETANLLCSIVEVTVFALGILSFVILLLRSGREPEKLCREGAFGVPLEADADYAEVTLPAKRRVRLFFGAPMIVFCVLCALEMVLLLFMSATGVFV